MQSVDGLQSHLFNSDRLYHPHASRSPLTRCRRCLSPTLTIPSSPPPSPLPLQVSMRKYLNATFTAVLSYADVLLVNLGAWYRPRALFAHF